MFLQLLVLALAISITLAQVPTPCTTPPQWESRVFGYDRDRQSMTRARVSYDAIYKRIRLIEEYTLGAEDDFYDVLSLFNQNVEYVYNLKTKACTKQAITRSWRDYGIPSNATSFGESYVGSSAVPSANLLVTLWGDKFADEKGNEIDYLGVWTYEACLPVNRILYSKADNFDDHQSFFDITPGISDPNAFLPRRECLSL